MRILLSTAMVVCGLLCGCEDDDSTTGTLPEEVLVQWGDFTITADLTLGGQSVQEFSEGQTPNLHLHVTYSGTSQTNVTYNDGSVYDFIILNEEGMTIWRWSDGLGFTQALWGMTINTNDVLDYAEPWTVSVGSGTYELRAIWSIWPEPPPAQIWFHVAP